MLLVPFALRGWWRGLCRETLAIAGLVGGTLAAAALGPSLADVLAVRRLVPPAATLPVAWAAILLAACLVAAVAGRIADRIARALMLGGVNRLAGALFGSVKGAALLGFMLLLVEHVAPSPAVTPGRGAAGPGRPLGGPAGSVAATGRELGTSSPGHRA